MNEHELKGGECGGRVWRPRVSGLKRAGSVE